MRVVEPVAQVECSVGVGFVARIVGEEVNGDGKVMGWVEEFRVGVGAFRESAF